jgi:hypothetical protein
VKWVAKLDLKDMRSSKRAKEHVSRHNRFLTCSVPDFHSKLFELSEVFVKNPAQHNSTLTTVCKIATKRLHNTAPNPRRVVMTRATLAKKSIWAFFTLDEQIQASLLSEVISDVSLDWSENCNSSDHVR